MKRESKHQRGGGSRRGEPKTTKYRQGVGKILTKKKVTKLSKAKVKRIAARRIGREAALEQLESRELCWDLSSKFARASAKKTGDTIGEVPDRYEAIALGFAAVGSALTGGVAHPALFRYSLSSVLRSSYRTDEALKAFLAKLDKWVRDYIWACTRGEQDNYSWTLCRYPVSRELRIMLADEYARDREALMRFLSACFKRWRKFGEPDSLFRKRLVTQQMAALYGHDRVRHLNYQQKIGLIPNKLEVSQQDDELYKIGQHLSRDQRTAVEKGFGSPDHPKRTSFGNLLRRPSEFAVRRNVQTR
jgi:hypothetical protein